MNREVYKVVSESEVHIDYCSAMFKDLPEKFNLTYAVGKRTVPNYGKIFVFDTLENAVAFIEECKGLHILKGVAENVGRPKHLAELFYYVTLMRFWNNKKKKKYQNITLRVAPKGSISCTAFTATENVWSPRR